VPRCLPLTILCLLGLTATAFAKPRSTQADTVLDACKWAAEVQILTTKASTGEIQVRVTDDKKKIFFGQKPGGKLKVRPPEASRESTLSDLEKLAGKDEHLLMVVNQDDHIEFVGKLTGKKKDSYILRTWYDFNAWWIFSIDSDFGTKIEDAGIPMQTLQVSAAELRTRMAKRR
jgi:hypothetical protein